MKLDKIKIHEQILKQLSENYSALAESALIAKEASTNEESKAENKYDTRGLEASYLAGAQSKRALDLKEKIYQVKGVNLAPYIDDNKISIGNLVCLLREDTEEEVYIFLLPVGGETVKIDSVEVKSITPKAPLGRLVIGKLIGDEFLFRKTRYEIIDCF